MRGAGLRLHNDVRRLWRCAACGLERRAGAEVTSVACECSGNPAMQLVEARRQERALKEPVSPYLEFVFEPGELNPPRPPEEEVLSSDGPVSDDSGAPPTDSGDQVSDRNSRPARTESRPPRRGDHRAGNRSPQQSSGNHPPDRESADRPSGRGPRETHSERTARRPKSESDTPSPPSPDSPSHESQSSPSDDFGAGLE